MRTALLVLTVALAASASGAAQTAGPPALAVEWDGGPRWLDGADVQRRFFGGGVDFGTSYVFSTVPDPDMPPVRVVFDAGLETVARAFGYREGLRDRGTATFRGAAYDVSDPARPRRLNVGVVEDPQAKPPDAVWNPDGSPTGAREWLLVLSSDYAPGAPAYAGAVAYGADVYYGLSLRVADGRTLYEGPGALVLTPARLRDVVATATDNGRAQVAWTAATYARGTAVRVRDGERVLATAAPATGGVAVSGLDRTREAALTVELVGDGGPLAERVATVRPVVSRGVEAASTLDPGRAGDLSYGDLWGYTAPDGTEYALLTGRGAGLSVIDVTAAPAQAPVEVAFVPAPPGSRDAKDVKVFGRWAYVGHEVGPVQIVDLADPRAPVEVGLLDVQPGVAQGGSHNVVVARGHLWVTGGRTSGNAGVRVYSLADPAAPALVGTYRPDHLAVPYYHDFEVVGDRGYGPAIYGGGVDVLDVSDPSAIRRVGSLAYPGAGAHNTCTSPDGRTVYVGDEVGSAGNWMRVFDVSDPDDPELVGEVVVDRRATVHNCYVRGDRLYVAHYTEGLRVFDVSDPHAPAEVALFDTFRQPAFGFHGAWTAYPYFASGKVIVSDLEAGLWVVRLGDGAATPAERAPDLAAGLRVWPNPAASRATVAYDLVAPGRVRLTVADVLGREVAVVDDGARPAGPHRAEVDLAGLPAGVYVARLAVGGRVRASARLTVAR